MEETGQWLDDADADVVAAEEDTLADEDLQQAVGGRPPYLKFTISEQDFVFLLIRTCHSPPSGWRLLLRLQGQWLSKALRWGLDSES